MQPVRIAEDTCIGMVEVGSVPRGHLVLDHVIKEAPIHVLMARPVAPAKFIVLFESEVEAVRRSLERARDVAADRLVDELFLPQPHPHVAEAIQKTRLPKAVDAFATVQPSTVAASIRSADGAAKTGDVEIIELRMAMGLHGAGFFTLTGEVSSVEAAVDQAKQLAQGDLVDVSIIAGPDPETARHFLDPTCPFSDTSPPS